jgi:hypothetical protein
MSSRRAALIKQASELPKGSDERREILAKPQKKSYDKDLLRDIAILDREMKDLFVDQWYSDGDLSQDVGIFYDLISTGEADTIRQVSRSLDLLKTKIIKLVKKGTKVMKDHGEPGF